jgi:hypothetical protein
MVIWVKIMPVQQGTRSSKSKEIWIDCGASALRSFWHDKAVGRETTQTIFSSFQKPGFVTEELVLNVPISSRYEGRLRQQIIRSHLRTGSLLVSASRSLDE